MKKKRELEKHIEKRFLKELKKRWPLSKTRKMNGYGNRSWPDRLVILHNGARPFIEFKRPGEYLSPGQENLFNELRLLGHRVFICFSAVEALEICDAEILNARRKKI